MTHHHNILEALRNDLDQFKGELDLLKTSIEEQEAQGQTLDIYTHQINTSVAGAFANVKQTLEQIKNGSESMETKEDILKAINEAAGGRLEVAQWLSAKIGIDYAKLKQNPSMKLSKYDLVSTTPAQLHHTVAAQEFVERKKEAETQWKNLRPKFKTVLAKSIAELPKEDTGKLSEPTSIEATLNTFYEKIRIEYLEKGYFPKYEMLALFLADAAMDNFNFFQKLGGSFMKAFNKGTDYDALQESLKINIETYLSAENVQRDFDTAETTLRSTYQPGMYEKLQNDENILENKHGHRDPETLNNEELKEQVAYEKKQVELLESIDEYDEESVRDEYRDGVLAGTIGITYAAWFAKYKEPHLKGMDKTIHTLKKIAKPFMKVWTIIQNFWEKVFGDDEDMTWADVFNTKKKEDNEPYQEAKERLKTLEDLKQKQGILTECNAIADAINPAHKTELATMKLEQLKSYRSLASAHIEFDAQKKPTKTRDTMIGKAFLSLQKPSNILLLSQWEKTGYAKLENGMIALGTLKINMTDAEIEHNKAFLLMDDALYAHWPAGLKISYPKGNIFDAPDPLIKAERGAFNFLDSLQITQMYGVLQSSSVQSFLKSLKANPKIAEGINTGIGEWPRGKTLSLELLTIIADKKLVFSGVKIPTAEEKKSENHATKVWNSIKGMAMSEEKKQQLKEKKFLATTDKGDFPFDHFGDLIDILKG